MNEKIKKLMEEKKLYEAHDECPVLQKKELISIANAIIAVSKELQILTEEDKKAIEWANNFIAAH